MTIQGVPAPGWYPAPHANNELRYWDGASWQEYSTQRSAPTKKSRKGLWITLGVVAGVVVIGGIGAALGGGDTDPVADADPVATTSTDETPDPAEEVVEPAEEEADPAVEEEPEPVIEEAPEPEKPALTMGQQNAVGAADNYLSLMAFSRQGLIEQLEFEGYSNEDASFAVDHVAPDWNEQAASKAEEYVDMMSFSRQGLIDQLVFEGFTQEQAAHGAAAVGY